MAQTSERSAGIMLSDDATAAANSIAAGSAVGSNQGVINVVRIFEYCDRLYLLIAKNNYPIYFGRLKMSPLRTSAIHRRYVQTNRLATERIILFQVG